MKFAVSVGAATLLFTIVHAAQHSFNGHQVLQITTKLKSELEKVLAMHHVYNLDIWRQPTKLNNSLEVYVTPDKMDNFLQELKHIDADVKVWIDDIQKLIDEERASHKRAFNHPKTGTGRNFALDKYHTYDEIVGYIQDAVAATSGVFGVHAESQSIGITTEGRDIHLIKITNGDGAQKPKIFFDGGIHAREWISPAFMVYLIHELVFDRLTDLLNHFDFHIVPVLNPDGYEYSRLNYRLWRKNRSVNERNCYGTDLNRNFGYEWDPKKGGSTNPCNDVYSGPREFSELESKALQNYILANGDFLFYLTVHSYGQMWLHPWGYTSALPTDVADLDRVAKVATAALRSTYGTSYIVGSSTNVLYAAAGGSDDWAKGGAGIKYSYTLELRDTGAHGFILPPEQILPTCIETWNGVVAMLQDFKSQRG